MSSMKTAVTSVLAEAPKATDWMSGWSAVISTVLAAGALIAAVFAAVATVRTNRMQSEQLRQLGEDRQSELAGKFGLWLESAGFKEARVLYHNSAHLPAYDVAAYFHIPSMSATFKVSLGNISPTATIAVSDKATRELAKFLDGLLVKEFDGPVTSRDELGDQRFISGAQTRRDEMLDEIEITISFTDANGKAWRRKPNGGLMLTGSTEG